MDGQAYVDEQVDRQVGAAMQRYQLAQTAVKKPRQTTHQYLSQRKATVNPNFDPMAGVNKPRSLFSAEDDDEEESTKPAVTFKTDEEVDNTKVAATHSKPSFSFIIDGRPHPREAPPAAVPDFTKLGPVFPQASAKKGIGKKQRLSVN